MSQINVNRIKDSNEGAPDFPSGVNVGGITSTVTLGVTNLNPTNVNVSGVVTATTLDGNLLATGTPTLGLGVTINTSGLNISGVATAGIVSATTLYGNGANLTGIALSIAPLNYNPAAYGIDLDKSTGIGLTFNQGVKSGSGNVTLRETNGSGTVVQNWGVGSSITYTGDEISMSLDSNLSGSQLYHLSYPSGAFTNLGGDVSYVGTAYTFVTKAPTYSLWSWGRNNDGELGDNSVVSKSSPVQIPGTTWDLVSNISPDGSGALMTKTDGTLWGWGRNNYGQLGVNNTTKYSSPVQTGSDTDWAMGAQGNYSKGIAVKTDGTLWVMGRNLGGCLGQNSEINYSSPVQIPGTTWSSDSTKNSSSQGNIASIKTDGTLWMWGSNGNGELAQNDVTQRSSPVQVPGTTWSAVSHSYAGYMAIKTDGTLWGWGYNYIGALGQNNEIKYSSPTQVPGTTWSKLGGTNATNGAIKTDGTLWMWGANQFGEVGDGTNTHRSSPVQVPGTTWKQLGGGAKGIQAVKTDGTLWAWGSGTYGGGGQNNRTNYNSPVQIPGTSWAFARGNGNSVYASKEI